MRIKISKLLKLQQIFDGKNLCYLHHIFSAKHLKSNLDVHLSEA
jgi:hypothetical protein